jgi:hypothetical protein
MGLAVVLPATAIAIPTYTVARFADWRVGRVLGVGAACSVGFGVALAHKLPERTLRGALATVLDAGSLGLWFPSVSPAPRPVPLPLCTISRIPGCYYAYFGAPVAEPTSHRKRLLLLRCLLHTWPRPKRMDLSGTTLRNYRETFRRCERRRRGAVPQIEKRIAP